MCLNNPQTTISSSMKPLNPFAKPFLLREKSTPKSPAPAPENYYRYSPCLVRYYCLKCQGAGDSEEKIKPVNLQPPKERVRWTKYNRRCMPFYGRRRFVPPRQAKMEAQMPRQTKMEVKQVWVPKRWSYNVDAAPRAPTVRPPLHHDFDDQKTSVMMRNIPNQYRRDELLEFLDKYCLEYHLEYDFAYLPMDFRRHNNKGYAFINFTKPDYARLFQEVLNGYKWGGVFMRNNIFNSNKTCEITWAKIQGKEGLVRHFQNSNFPCYNAEYLPVELSPPSKGSAFVSTLIPVGRYLGSSST